MRDKPGSFRNSIVFDLAVAIILAGIQPVVAQKITQGRPRIKLKAPTLLDASHDLGDLAPRWSTSLNIEGTERLKFRWTTYQKGAAKGRWEVSNSQGRVFRSGKLNKAPAAGKYYTFYIDFRKIPTATKYQVRVRALSSKGGTLGPSSLPVNVTRARPGPITKFTDKGLGLPIKGTSQAAVPDPGRNATTLTKWEWWKNRTEVQINQMRKAGKRIIDLELTSRAGRFDVVLVRNVGVYKRSEGWWFGFTRNQVVAKVKEKKGRIIDLEPYTVRGKRRFTFSLVRNEGDAAKSWWWNYDLTPQQVAEEIKKRGLRLIDLDTYVVNRKRLYSYVGIKNAGVDRRAWWWYYNVSPSFVKAKLKENKARLIDIEHPSFGKLTVVMQRDDGTYWWWGYGLSQARLEELYSIYGSRLIDLESYISNGKRRFAFIAIDNANAESRRLWKLLTRTYDNSAFGDQVIRGLYVKQIGGPTLADIAAGLKFQPLSTLKLLPYLYTMIEIDKGKATLDGTSVSWIEATRDDPKTKDFDERKYASCLKKGTANTRLASAKLRDALPTMMWESHNRTLDAVLEKYGPSNLTARAHQLGLRDTKMYYGCAQPNGPSRPWAANRSTLIDLGKLFSGVDKLQFIRKNQVRKAFFDNMINLDYGGASYSSPITGRKVGPLNSRYLRDIVKREAGPGKQGIVEEFLKHVVIRGKGGSGGPSTNEFGYSDFLHVTLPFRAGAQIVPKTFVVGWFVYKLKTPKGCPESKGKDGGKCQAIWQPERNELQELKREIHTLPIRMALKTWPKTP